MTVGKGKRNVHLLPRVGEPNIAPRRRAVQPAPIFASGTRPPRTWGPYAWKTYWEFRNMVAQFLTGLRQLAPWLKFQDRCPFLSLASPFLSARFLTGRLPGWAKQTSTPNLFPNPSDPMRWRRCTPSSGWASSERISSTGCCPFHCLVVSVFLSAWNHQLHGFRAPVEPPRNFGLGAEAEIRIFWEHTPPFLWRSHTFVVHVGMEKQAKCSTDPIVLP